MASWWQNVQNNLGSMGNPTYGSLSPQAQQQANMGAFTNIGAQMSQRSNQNPMQAIGGALGAQQKQAGVNARQQMAAKMFEDNQKKAEQEQERTRKQNELWTSSLGRQFEQQLGLPEGTMTNLDMASGLAAVGQFSKLRKGGGRWATPEEKQAAGFDTKDTLWVGDDGKPSLVGGRAANVSVTTGNGGAGTMKRFEETQGAAAEAQSILAPVRDMRNLLDAGVKTGFGEPWKMEIKKAFGIDLGQVAGQEAFTGLSNKMIGPMVKMLGSNPTDKDLAFFVAASPTLSKTEQGNRLMLDGLELSGKRKEVIARVAEDYMLTPGLENMPAMEQRIGLERKIRALTTEHPLWTEESAKLQKRYKSLISGGGGAGGNTTSTGVTWTE